MNKLLTIAIPTYNGSNTICTMLDILLPQVSEEVELIVCDNCSTDNTFEIISKYSEQYPIRYIRNEKNIGPDANFLKCMKLAEGKYTFLLSDDDILIEGALVKILDFLKKYDDVDFIYLETVGFKQNYNGIKSTFPYKEFNSFIKQSLCTNDKKEFMNYSIRMWGFMSSYAWKTSDFQSIDNPELYFNTYWLQSYIHILCCNGDKKLGVIKGPIIAAGQYAGVNNFDVSVVDGINYLKMMEFAINHGFDEKQLKKFYLWRVCFLGRNAVLKEKIAKRGKTRKKTLFSILHRKVYAWFHLFPYFFIPRWVLLIRNKIVGYKAGSNIKRLEE